MDLPRSATTRWQPVMAGASPEELDLIERASAASGDPVEAFILRASLAQARDLLADGDALDVPPARWSAFLAMLDGSAGSARDQCDTRASSSRS